MCLLLRHCSRGSWEQVMLLEALSYFWRLRKVSGEHLPFSQKLSGWPASQSQIPKTCGH